MRKLADRRCSPFVIRAAGPQDPQVPEDPEARRPRGMAGPRGAVTVLAGAGLLVALAAALPAGVASPAAGPEATGQEALPARAEIQAMMGRTSEGDLVRGQLDTVGYVHTAAQAEDLLRALGTSTGETTAATGADGPWIGGVCPHDDHLYSARTAMRLIEGIQAPRVILVGVFHTARLWRLRDRLVLDDFAAWHGPSGPVPVDGLREDLMARLDSSSFVVDNAMHEREHSLEGLVPLLQHRRPGVSIVPILVPYMDWSRIEELADELARALHEVLGERGWELGRDVAIVISNDAVHYGPDFDHAPFGTGIDGYDAAVERDRALIRSHLEGRLQPESLRALQHELVDAGDVTTYRIPWCGRFSVPFGLELLRRTAALEGRPVPGGRLLRYATSLSDPEPPVTAATREAGLGTTAPSNLHHWVGFFALGVR